MRSCASLAAAVACTGADRRNKLEALGVAVAVLLLHIMLYTTMMLRQELQTLQQEVLRGQAAALHLAQSRNVDRGHGFLFVPLFANSCRKGMFFGGSKYAKGEGGWWLCGDTIPAPLRMKATGVEQPQLDSGGCVVYSFGINDDWSFDKAISDGCVTNVWNDPSSPPYPTRTPPPSPFGRHHAHAQVRDFNQQVHGHAHLLRHTHTHARTHSINADARRTM